MLYKRIYVAANNNTYSGVKWSARYIYPAVAKFLHKFLYPVPNFTVIHQVGASLMQERQMDRHGDVNRRFSGLFERAYKWM
jgi:hypothetical protein